MASARFYVSVTGLRPKGPRQLLPFWWHTACSLLQARRASGNLAVRIRPVKGVYHTLTVWTDEAAMRAFLVSGAHRRAMQAVRSIGTARTLGFLAERVPDWDEALDLWSRLGRDI